MSSVLTTSVEAGVDPAPVEEREARWTRLVLPLALPIGAAVMLAVFAVNISRILLAAGSTGAIVTGVVLIVVILGGGAAMSAAPRMRTSSLVMIGSAGLIVLVSAGLVAAPASVAKTTSGGNGLLNPKGPAAASLSVVAEPGFHFNAQAFTVPAGIMQINYSTNAGGHTLAIDNPNYASLLLQVPGGPTHAKVLLKPGSYVIYCTFAGHRAAGMQATITVK